MSDRKAPTSLRDTAHLLKLKAQVEALSAADRLRLCAGLIERGDYVIAETLGTSLLEPQTKVHTPGALC